MYDKNIDDKDLPHVSILTITRNRFKFWKAGLPLYNFNIINYPKEKLEWIIIDDSNTKDLKKLIPPDNRIKYIYINKDKNIPLKIRVKS